MEKIVILGLGYVGLPVAVALAQKFDDVTGFDISSKRVAALAKGHDWTGEICDQDMRATSLNISDDPDVLRNASFIIVTVPTPIDGENRPDLSPIRGACDLIGPRLNKGALVVFESTVYPGVTDDICGPMLAEKSGMERGSDFTLGYSPERINPGDKIHRLEKIVKIIAAEDGASLARMQSVYGAIIEAGLHVAPTIKVAEAAKVIENTQRDLNIALVNEFSLIFDLMGIRTNDVLVAAQTKWNFLPFTPGLVGGHCIGVDPYYLTSAAQKLGYNPEVILAGRRINDDMGAHIARKSVKFLIKSDQKVSGARVGIIGLTFKEDVPDLRNSKVPDIITELNEYGVEPLVFDPHADVDQAFQEFGINLCSFSELEQLDLLIYAVPHNILEMDAEMAKKMTKKNGIIIDIKSRLDSKHLTDRTYWSL